MQPNNYKCNKLWMSNLLDNADPKIKSIFLGSSNYNNVPYYVTITEDKAIITLGFKDGSVGSINYFANGHKSFPKERIEIFTSGKILKIDNFRILRGFGWSNFKKSRLIRQDKGQLACPAAFVKAIEGGLENPIPINEIFEVARITLEAAKQLNTQ